MRRVDIILLRVYKCVLSSDASSEVQKSVLICVGISRRIMKCKVLCAAPGVLPNLRAAMEVIVRLGVRWVNFCLPALKAFVRDDSVWVVYIRSAVTTYSFY